MSSKVITFKPSWMRLIAGFGAVAFCVVAVRSLAFTERGARFTCTRDEAGRGTCDHTITFLGRVQHESFDAQSLQSTRLEQVDEKGVRRLLIRVGGKEVPFSHDTSLSELPEIAAKIDDFVRDPTQRRLDVDLPDPFRVIAWSAAFQGGMGIAMMFWMLWRFPRRRLVLDEGSGTARLERCRFRRWVPEWSRPLSDLKGARLVRGHRSSYVVLDTESDGALPIVLLSRAQDPAVDEINALVNVSGPGAPRSEEPLAPSEESPG